DPADQSICCRFPAAATAAPRSDWPLPTPESAETFAPCLRSAGRNQQRAWSRPIRRSIEPPKPSRESPGVCSRDKLMTHDLDLGQRARVTWQLGLSGRKLVRLEHEREDISVLLRL